MLFMSTTNCWTHQRTDWQGACIEWDTDYPPPPLTVVATGHQQDAELEEYPRSEVSSGGWGGHNSCREFLNTM
jgi:hypothetical protein